MLSLFSTLIGFLSSGVPHVLEFFRENKNKAHELEVMKLKLEAAKSNNAAALEIADKKAKSSVNVAEAKSIYKTYETGITWVDALNGLVRPAAAFTMLAIYCVIECMIFYAALERPDTSLAEITEMLWDEEDHIFFGIIISYYFGSRAIDKLKSI